MNNHIGLCKRVKAATCKKCEEKTNAMIINLNYAVSNWENIGQGDSGVNLSLDSETNNPIFASLKNSDGVVLDLHLSLVPHRQTYHFTFGTC